MNTTNEDTKNLLRECSSGVKMGITAIDDVLDRVESDELYDLLRDSRNEHDKLEGEIKTLLDRMGDDGSEEHPVAQEMARMKTGAKLVVERSDNAIADILTDGCNTGVKSLHRYLNKYEKADEQSREITRRLVNIEERLSVDMRSFL